MNSRGVIHIRSSRPCFIFFYKNYSVQNNSGLAGTSQDIDIDELNALEDDGDDENMLDQDVGTDVADLHGRDDVI